MRLLAPLAVLLLAGSAHGRPGGVQEMRGVWVVRTALQSPAGVDAAIDEAHRAGANAVFVQVRGRGDAFYQSSLVVRSDLLAGQPATFDPLQRVIAQARTRGLAVHAWFNVLLTANFGQRLPPDHVIARHPEWVMQPQGAARRAFAVAPTGLPWLARQARTSGDVEGLYLTPSAPGVAQHLEAAVRELVRRYPVDGFHLDFIRYPSAEYDYSRAALEGFARRLGVASAAPWTLPARHPAAWDEHRRSVLSDLAARLTNAARSERPAILVSAAVVPDEAQALNHRYQDWPDWGARSLLDAVCPMAYTADSRIFRQQVAQARARVGDRARVWAGVGAYRLDVPGIVEKVHLAREAGATGVILFSHESLRGQDVDRLRREAFPPVVAARPAPSAVTGGTSAR
jgi:uncharacterized lipoprotein YddW (UPF0748 family)